MFEISKNVLSMKIVGNDDSNETDEQERIAWSMMLRKVADELSEAESYGNVIVDSAETVVGEWLIRPSHYEEEPGDEVGSSL